MIRDTPGNFNNIAAIVDDDNDNVVNLGMKTRRNLCMHNQSLECMDRLDLLGYNKRYIPTSIDFKVVLTRLEKTKMLLGDATHCAAANIHLDDFELRAPIMKPNAQLTVAINELMIQKGDECRFYRMTYRYVAFPIPVCARNITHRNIFNSIRSANIDFRRI